MTRRNREKRKKKSESDDDLNESKHAKFVQSPTAISPTIEISSILKETNTVLYSNDSQGVEQVDQVNVSVSNSFLPLINIPEEINTDNMAQSNKSDGAGAKSGPSNADIVALLGKIELKLTDMDKRLVTLESLEKKVDGFDKELRKLRLHIDETQKQASERLEKAEGRMFEIEIETGAAKKRIDELERERVSLKESVTYLQSQSMRNNLIFGNIEEEPQEKPERTEVIVRKFMSEKLKMAQNIVDGIKIERVHRMGPPPNVTGNNRFHRRIVCKFNMFTDREAVRKLSYRLKGTRFYLTEQFPPEVTAKRKGLVKQMKEERAKGNQAWLSYDTLYVNGRPVSDN